jgi:hypothetical protein
MLLPIFNLQPAVSERHGSMALTLGGLLMAALIGGTAIDAGHAARPKPKPKPPDLKILSVDPVPLPFIPAVTPLTFRITVELPKTIPDDALLDVSTLITSASRSSLRLLTTRQFLPNVLGATDIQPDTPRRVEIVQIWDGMDNRERLVAEGFYDYQVQVKLMVMSKTGLPLTKMNAWKKRGNFRVKSPASARSE